MQREFRRESSKFEKLSVKALRLVLLDNLIERFYRHGKGSGVHHCPSQVGKPSSEGQACGFQRSDRMIHFEQ